MLYVLQKLPWQQTKNNLDFLTIFTTIIALQNKLQQKQFDLT